jgi:hypothetical protein
MTDARSGSDLGADERRPRPLEEKKGGPVSPPYLTYATYATYFSMVAFFT